MSGFYECGQHFPPCGDQRRHLRATQETALLLDRVQEVLESWIDGRLIAKDPSQIKAMNAIHEYRECRSRHGIGVAQARFPDLG